MNRLTLAQKVQRLLRSDTNLPGTAPTTTLAQTGILSEIVSFVDDAYRDIQKAEDWWGFRLKQGTFNLAAGTRAYTRATILATITDFDEFLQPYSRGYRSVTLYLASTGVSDSSICAYLPYQQWRGYYDFGTRSSGKPFYHTIRQDQTMEFDPTPDAIYTCAMDYRRTLHVMTADADEPLFADDFHDAIVWGAVVAYKLSRGKLDNVYAEAKAGYKLELNRMRTRYLPEMLLDTTIFWGQAS